MLFNSYIFMFGFLPLMLLAVTVARGQSQRAVQLVVLMGSWIFYGWFVPALILLLIGSSLVNHTIGRWIESNRKSLLPLIAGLVFNLGLLAYFKYAGFLVANVSALLGQSWAIENILLPLAISFFTFQQVAYLVDLRRGTASSPELIEYCLFVAFFPQLVAGPIVHHKELIPQLRKPTFGALSVSGTQLALVWFTIGLTKKVLFADQLAPISDTIFTAADNGAHPSLLEAWSGVLAFTFQIYFDFSGYSDMAIGLGLLLGISLPINFNSPYRATSIIDFWRRWHITLSRFLRDYLYVPLGGNRNGVPRRYANLLLTMLLGGLWHGAAWTFVIWGGLHGLYLIVAHQWRRNFSAIPTMLGWVLTFIAVCMAWALFRAETLPGAVAIIEGLVGQNGLVLAAEHRPLLGPAGDILAAWGLNFEGVPEFRLRYLVLFPALIAAMLLVPSTQELTRYLQTERSWIQWRPTIVWGVTFGALLAIASLSTQNATDFIYFQF